MNNKEIEKIKSENLWLKKKIQEFESSFYNQSKFLKLGLYFENKIRNDGVKSLILKAFNPKRVYNFYYYNLRKKK